MLVQSSVTRATTGQETAVRWLILAIFAFGMMASLNWYEAATSERKLAFGLMAAFAFALVLVLGNTML